MMYFLQLLSYVGHIFLFPQLAGKRYLKKQQQNKTTAPKTSGSNAKATGYIKTLVITRHWLSKDQIDQF